MKIAYISLYGGLNSRQFRSGCHVATANTAKNISQRDHKVLYLCSGKKNKISTFSKNLEMAEVEALHDFELSLPVFTKDNKQFVFDVLTKFAPQIVHSQDISPLGMLAQKWAIENKIAFVTTLHTMPSDVIEFGLTEFFPLEDTEYYKRFKDFTARVLYKEFLNKCSKVIALNQSAKDDIINYVRREKIEIIPNGLDLSKFMGEKSNINGEINLTFTGNLTRRKNQEFLIKAQRYLPNNYKLQLLGRSFSQIYADTLKDLQIDSINTNIDFLGNVPNSKIPSYLARTKVFVSASKKEVQSISIIEALASGTPIVALTNETTKELIDQNVGVLLPQNTSPDEFAEAVKSVAELNRSDYLKMSNECRRRSQMFSWENVCKQLETFYTKASATRTTGYSTKPYTNLFIYSLASVLIIKTFLTVKKMLQDDLEDN